MSLLYGVASRRRVALEGFRTSAIRLPHIAESLYAGRFVFRLKEFGPFPNVKGLSRQFRTTRA